VGGQHDPAQGGGGGLLGALLLEEDLYSRGEREGGGWRSLKREREKKKTLESKRDAPALAFFSLAWDMTDAQFR
jgi:hypothetical protein